MTSSATLKTGEVAAGSVWNKNSWHWEEKDYNKVAHQKIVEALESIELKIPAGEPVKLTNVQPSGFASISVRKGKKVIVFEFSIAMNFASSSSSGTVKIPEFSNDELDPTLRVDLGSGDESVKEFLRKDGGKQIKTALSKFVEFMNSLETGDQLMESDKLRREEELARAKQAEADKGLEKKQIAEAFEAKEIESVASKTFVEASVWNPNSYHWETRKLDKWAVEWIMDQLKTPEFSNVSVSGEAENSIRKGKKISIFNLKIEGQYAGCPFSVPSFSNEEGDDEIPRIVCEDSEIKKRILADITKRVFTPFLSTMRDQ